MTDEFHDKKVKELRAASGTVTSDDKLVGFLYDLIRDHLTPGVVEGLVQTAEECGEVIEKEKLEDGEGTIIFTNGWLANYALNLAERLRNK